LNDIKQKSKIAYLVQSVYPAGDGDKKFHADTVCETKELAVKRAEDLLEMTFLTLDKRKAKNDRLYSLATKKVDEFFEMIDYFKDGKQIINISEIEYIFK
jgi:hypothetical protein